MKKIELLSPAKDLETGIAAINCGADAIYIGANRFGARKSASNSIDDIQKLVNYAHKFYARVHVAINTILDDKELEQALALINELYKIGVDAIIVQDMGLLESAISKKLPPIQIHTSTQCNTRQKNKALFFDNVGVSRIVLARELNIEQIKEICKSVSCEVETFIHGALCVSYSGQCYLSYANGGRSANRGECAQPCRKKYSLIDENGKIIQKDKYLLSLKDFNASKTIEELIECGVKSFKIEGRLKDINYVRNITSYYSILIDKFAKRTSSGKIFYDFKPNPDKTFNRGYSEYFLKERQQCFNFTSPKSKGGKLGKIESVGKNYFIIDSNISPQDGICFISEGKMNGFLVNKVEGKKVYPNKMNGIKKGIILYRNYDSKFEKLLSNTKTTRKIGVQINVYTNKLTVTDEDNNHTEINLPQGEQPKNAEKYLETFEKQLHKTGDSDFYIDKLNFETSDIPFFPISQINEFRRILFKKLIDKRIENYPALTQNRLNHTPFPEKSLDYRANIYNKKAEDFYKSCNCQNIQPALECSSNIPPKIELMRTKHCLKYACGLCQQPTPKLYLQDDRGKKFPLKFDCKNCEMVILSS